MPQAEYGIVYLFTDGIEQGHVAVDVLCDAVGLDNLDTGTGEEVVDVLQVIIGDDVIGVQHQCDVIIIADGGHRCVQGLGLGALFKADFYQADGESGQGSIGTGLHAVGDDNDVVTVGRILLIQAGMHTLVYHGIFLIGGNEYGKPFIFLRRRRLGGLAPQRP